MLVGASLKTYGHYTYHWLYTIHIKLYTLSTDLKL